MSTAAAAVDAGDVVPKKGKKKLIIIVAAALLVAMLGGGAAVYMKKKSAAAAAAAEEGDEESSAAPAEKAHNDHRSAPTFVPLEPFVVNLADKETDRFAQVGVTLEVDDAKFAEEMKAYMPAIRSGILMVLAHKTSAQLLSPEGKVALAREIMRESVLPMGIEASDEEEAAPARKSKADAEADDEDAPKAKKKKKRASVHNPVKRVHFSNFIVQ
jgi:flagellar FliL protein